MNVLSRCFFDYILLFTLRYIGNWYVIPRLGIWALFIFTNKSDDKNVFKIAFSILRESYK